MSIRRLLAYLLNIVYTLVGGSMFWVNLQRQFRRYSSRHKPTSCKRGTSRTELLIGIFIVVAGAIIITLLLINR